LSISILFLLVNNSAETNEHINTRGIVS